MSLNINDVSLKRKPVPEIYEEEEGNLTFLSNASGDEANTSLGSVSSKNKTKHKIDNLFENANSSFGGNTHKKKDPISVSNNIKALQDKIKKGLDIKDDENTPVRRFRINKTGLSPAATESKHAVMDSTVVPKKLSFNQSSSSISEIKTSESKNSLDTSRDEALAQQSCSMLLNSTESVLKSKSPTETEKNITNSPERTSNQSMLGSNVHDEAPVNNPFTTSFSNMSLDSNGSNLQSKNSSMAKLKITNMQFKVLQKGTPVDSPLILSPSGNAYDTANIDSRSIISSKDGTKITKDLRQLQLIDKEITRKIKKIKNEIQFIDDSLPPNPCTYDIDTRRNLAKAREVLSKKLDFWDKKKYENGIALSKVSRKMVYSGGEQVTTFFSGRSE